MRSLPASFARARRRGFALLVTIVLVAFLVLILVGLASFTRVETQVAENSQNLAKARQNALFALNVALGELQRATGPDQRVTVTADIGTDGDGDAATPDNGLPAAKDGTYGWTAALGNVSNPINPADVRKAGHTAERPAVLNWLVSGNEKTTYTPSALMTSFGQISAAPPVSGAGAIRFGPNSAISGLDADTTVSTPLAIASLDGTVIRPAALLVGGGSAANSVTPTAPEANYVVAPLIDVISPAGVVPGLGATAAPIIGRYAWWVGDEGVKARVNLEDPNKTEMTNDAARLRTLAVARTGIEVVGTRIDDDGNLSGGFSEVDPQTAPLRSVLTDKQLSFLNSVTVQGGKNRFHDITPYSVGVLANVATGGLKKDLTAGLLGGTVPAELADSERMFTAPTTSNATASGDGAAANVPAWSSAGGTVTPANAVFPQWGALRRFAQTNASSGVVMPRPHTATQTGIFPLITRIEMRFHAVIEPGPSAKALYFPVVVLWNPYNVRMGAQKYGVNYNFEPGRTQVGNVMRPWESKNEVNGGTYDHTLTNFPLFYVEYAATAAETEATTGRRLGPGVFDMNGYSFVLDCPELEPGEARVFTPRLNTTYNKSSPQNNVLTGTGEHRFWYENINLGGGVGRVFRFFIGEPFFRSGFVTMAFGDTFDSDGIPTGPVAQRIAGLRDAETAAKGEGATATNKITIPEAGPSFAFPGPGVDTKSRGAHRVPYIPLNPSLLEALDLSGEFPLKPVGGGRAYRMQYSSLDTSGTAAFPAPIGSRWLANHNPVAAFSARTILEELGSSTSVYDRVNPLFPGVDLLTHSTPGVIVLDENGATYAGFSSPFYVNPLVTYPGGLAQRGILFELPRDVTVTRPDGSTVTAGSLMSLGALQHAYVHPAEGTVLNPAAGVVGGYMPSAMPAYAIGNSWADPRVPPEDVDGFPNSLGRLSPPAGRSAYLTSRRIHFDLSYLLNRALWDRYFFSTVPTSSALFPASGAEFYPLPNPRHEIHNSAGLTNDALATRLRNFDQAATSILVSGAFNINSTSEEAWRAVLSSARGAPVVGEAGTGLDQGSGQVVPFSRFTHGRHAAWTPADSRWSESAAAGFRSLSDEQIRRLAVEIVAEIRRRGPSLSLAGFVNRKPWAGGPATIGDTHSGTTVEKLVRWQRYLGPLQHAIDRASRNAALVDLRPDDGINNRLTSLKAPGYNNIGPADTLELSDRDNVFFSRAAAGGYSDFATAAGRLDPDVDTPISLNSSNAGAPGYLTQADILQALGPVLTARSDTFRIRVYGEAINPVLDDPGTPAVESSAITARAWAEVVVQRVPEHLDSTVNAETSPLDASLTAEQHRSLATFGRRYQVVSFRWLEPNDI